MKKNQKIIVVIVVAILCAGLACFGIFQVLAPERTTMYVFNEDYAAGTQVTNNMLTPIQVDSQIIVAGGQQDAASHFITADEYAEMLKAGDSLRIDVSKDFPLMSSMLSVTGGNKIEMAMKSDAVAITVSVDSVTGVTDDLSSGARVNVYVTYSSEGTSLLLENVRVLSVSKTSSGVMSTATLEVTNNDALKIVEAANKGSIYLGLVNSTGYTAAEITSTAPATETVKATEAPIETPVAVPSATTTLTNDGEGVVATEAPTETAEPTPTATDIQE